MEIRRIRGPYPFGYTRVAEPGPTPLCYLRIGIVRLRPGSEIRLMFPEWETILILLRGKGDLEWPERIIKVHRLDVFRELATALYFPPGMGVHLKAEEEMEWAVIHAPGDPELPPRLITPDLLHPRVTGGKGFQRQIVEILGPDLPARHLLVGETLTFEGNWSSYPPHKHDEDRPGEEVPLEEVYIYKIDPPFGFALQWIYSPRQNEEHLFAVRSDDIVIIPRGYHPVAAPPGYSVYYLWAMAGERRVLQVSTDPAHRWLLDHYRLSSPR
jgi:5-deoxy-glucuronate isomerase